MKKNITYCVQLISIWILGLSAAFTTATDTFEFDDDSTILGPSTLLPDWHETVQRSLKEQEQIEDCLKDEEACTRRMKPLRTLILRGRGLSPSRQLTLVNNYINRRRSYSRDKRTYKEYEDFRILKRQEWSTLLEFLDKGGDCEDYATAKYQLLKLLGHSEDHLRIMVVYDRKVREHHALVAVYDEKLGTQLLDNDNAIHRRRPFAYRYVYSLSDESIWDHALDKVRKPRKLPIKDDR